MQCGMVRLLKALAIAAVTFTCLVPPLGCETEAGFVPLFNGKDLTGWTGGKYVVENGILVCPPNGGKILTEKEYANFVLRFELRMPAGANNGVAIRAPRQGDPAYVGMEIQILDETKRKPKGPGKGLHGAIYDVFAAQPGALKPAGEWNEEEILVDGRHVKVTVNGKVIVDANLDDIKDEKTLQKHPGLQRTSGYIGFLGHGDRVEFRNIRIKELKK